MAKLSTNHLIFAALMHDIGKVIQRTSISKDWETNKHIDKCVFAKNNNYSTYRHGMFTSVFLEKYPLPLNDWETVIELAGCHHNKSVFQHTEYEHYLNYLIEADRTAASWDREKSEESGHGSNYFRKIPLLSLFDTISFDKDKKFKPSHSIPLKKRTPQAVIDYDINEERYDLSRQYTSLWKSFLEDFEEIYSFFYKICQHKKEDFIDQHYSQYIDAVESLFEQYFWCVPSNTNEKFPTNSLYHHSRNTATIAATISQSRDVYGYNDNSGLKEFMIISGDLNGIQDYLYDLNPEKASKSSKLLRSRSFQIKVIMDMIALKIIRQLKLSSINIFMNAGGKWLMLAPNNKSVKSELDVIKKETEAELYSKFFAKLSVNINWETDIELNDLNKNNFIKTLNRVLENTEEEKLTRFSMHLSRRNTEEKKWQSDKFIINDEALYNENICPLCYKRRIDHSKPAEEELGEDKVCPSCYDEVILGEKLVKEEVYCISSSSGKSQHSLINFSSMEFDYVPIKNGELFKPKPGRYYFRTNSENDFIEIPIKHIATGVPKFEDGKLLTFEDIAEKSFDKDNNSGIKANAVVKGDVDNLGLIFQHGLLRRDEKDELYCSITDYTSLSAMIDYYFSVYLPHIIKDNYADSIYTVYAGGDDFCLVGAYDKVIDFTKRLYEDFSQFTNHNKEIHFSCAIRLMQPKEPVKHAITDTENLLSKTKDAVINGERKNKLWLFETIVPWDKIEKLMDFSQDLDEYIDKKVIGVQFLYRLLAYNEMYLETKKDQTHIHNFLYDSLLNYDIKRNIEKKENNIVVNRDIVNQLRQLSVVSDENYMDYLRIPICKSLYKKRRPK